MTPESKAHMRIAKIVVATDFSEPSEVAVRYAAALAERFQASLTVVHVIDLSIALLSGDAPMGPALDSMRETGKQGLEDSCRFTSAVPCVSELVEGLSVADEVLSIAHGTMADLLVIATTSKKGFSKAVFGSKAENIYRTSDIPVLVVGPKVPSPPRDGFACAEIVYASDLLQRKLYGLRFAIGIAQGLGAKLHLCHVVDQKDTAPVPLLDEEIKLAVQGNLKDCGQGQCQVVGSIEYGKTKEVILGLAERLKAGLIILGARNYSFWLTYFETGISTAVIAESRCPVLVLGSRSISEPEYSAGTGRDALSHADRT